MAQSQPVGDLIKLHHVQILANTKRETAGPYRGGYLLQNIQSMVKVKEQAEFYNNRQKADILIRMVTNFKLRGEEE